MIGYLSGQILDRNQNELLFVLGQSSGKVGYLIKIPGHAKYEQFQIGSQAELFIYSHIREDAFDLYGFSTTNEKQFFLILLSVSGVGPKMALSLLSEVSSEELISIILAGDKEALTRVPGVGKKTAERMIVELKDTLQKKVEAGLLKSSASHSRSDRIGAIQMGPLFVEGYLALQGLGYKEQQAKQMIEQALIKNPETKKVEDLIKLALQSGARA